MWNDISVKNNQLWLKIDRDYSKDILNTPSHEIQVRSLSLGTFTDPGTFHNHWTSENRQLTAIFEHNLQTIQINSVQTRYLTLQMKIKYQCLDKFLLTTTSQDDLVFHIYFFLQSRPKLFSCRPRKTPYMETENRELQIIIERTVDFGSCSGNVVGSSNVLHLEILKHERNLINVVSRFHKFGFDIFTGSPKISRHVSSKPIDTKLPISTSFDLSCAWFCLKSHGFKITDHLTDLNFSAFDDLTDAQLVELIHTASDVCDNTSIFDVRKTFQQESERIRRQSTTITTAEDDLLDFKHLVKIRRLVFTPTNLRGFREEWTTENRVVRKYSADRFIRVVIRDEDFCMIAPSFARLNGPINKIKSFLKQGVQIADRHYKFLTRSNSQLREHGLWLYASDGIHTVESIRDWMGDVSHERCVGTYIARLGQCFTSTKETVQVDNVVRIPDIEHNNFIFTDGIGKISKALANQGQNFLP